MSRWQYSCEHTGPGTLAGRYMRQFWQPVHALEAIAPGGVKPLRIMGEDLTLYRGESGTPYVVGFRCAHRGTQLSVGRVFGEDIRCMYHGWKYTGRGQCVEQPGELAQQFASRVKIRGCPTRAYRGLIFAYLGDGDAPEFPIFPELEGDGLIDARHYRRACNLTNFLDNQLDEAHVGFTHPEGFARIPEIPEIRIDRTEFTAVSHCSRPGRVDRITEFLMPNILRFKSTTPFEGVHWGDAVSWRVPLDDRTTLSFMIARFVATTNGEAAFNAREKRLRELPVPDVDDLAARILAGELTFEDAAAEMGEHDPRYTITLQDHLTMGGQEIVADRDTEVLGTADAGIVAIRDLWNEQLEDLNQHGEGRVWVQPPPTVVTSGEERRESAALSGG